MIFTSTDGSIKEVYSYSKITDTVNCENQVSFKYPLGMCVYGANFKKEVIYNTLWGKDITEFIINAKSGKYPPID
jgi:hypothetical protein